MPLWLAALSTGWIYLYVFGLFGWFAAQRRFGDRWWWLFLLNTIAAYLFLPLPLALLGALALGRGDTWLLSGAALALGAHLYGELFVPRPRQAHAGGRALTVMTFNLLGFHADTAATIAALRRSQADVIALQELNGQVAEAIERDLGDRYPYQVLQPQQGASGMGTISRYPLRRTGETLPGRWIGPPQILELDFGGTPVTLINVHTISIVLDSEGLQADIERSAREREREAGQIAGFAAENRGPLIVLGDFNTGELSAAYRALTARLRDSWRERGSGLGHTFPGGDTPENGRPSVAGIAVPMWLARIDYVFHSDDWSTAAARIGEWDGRSDHRPVVVELTLAR